MNETEAAYFLDGIEPRTEAQRLAFKMGAQALREIPVLKARIAELEKENRWMRARLTKYDPSGEIFQPTGGKMKTEVSVAHDLANRLALLTFDIQDNCQIKAINASINLLRSLDRYIKDQIKQTDLPNFTFSPTTLGRRLAIGDITAIFEAYRLEGK
jgi:hypothetical protein